MGGTPDITVVTAVFNLIDAGRREMFLQAVRSVQAQRGCMIEHIVVDGASSDGTAALLEEARGINPALIVISEPDDGLFDAMNKGAAAARGEAVIFLNSDDFYHDPQGLSRGMAAMREPGADYTCAPLLVLEEGREPRRAMPPKLHRALLAMPFGHPALLMKRELFDALRGFDLRFGIGADYHLILRMVLSGAHGAVLDTDFVSFRAGGVSGDLDRTHDEAARIKADVLGPRAGATAADFEVAQREKRLPLRVAVALAIRSLREGAPPRGMALYALWTTLRRMAFSLHLGHNRRFMLLGFRIF